MFVTIAYIDPMGIEATILPLPASIHEFLYVREVVVVVVVSFLFDVR